MKDNRLSLGPFWLLILALPSRITPNLWDLCHVTAEYSFSGITSSPSQIGPSPFLHDVWYLHSPQTPCWPLSMLQFAGTLRLQWDTGAVFIPLETIAAWFRAWKKGGALPSSWCFKVFIVFWINSFFFHFWLSFKQWKSKGMVRALETTSRLTLAQWSVWYWYNCWARYNATS